MKKINHTSKIKNDKYTQYIYDNFDIQNNEESKETITYDLSKLDSFDWNIGVIYGSSGSGKTSILKDFGIIQKANFDNDKSLISNFDWLEPKDATRLLTSMGLSSVPTWLRPFKVLSNGEQYRAELAYKVGKAQQGEVILIDEFTSVVNRDVAKAMSYSLQKYLRRENKKIIVASCHYDIMEWLLPDWICSPQNGGKLELWRGRRQRPQIELKISRVEADTWNLFKKHHYLTEQVNKSCKFFLFTWNDKIVGIVVLATLPSGTIKNGERLSRTVVLPDYQGLGIGSRISEFICSITRGTVFTKTINPSLGIYRENSKYWEATAKNGKQLRGQSKEKGENTWTTKSRPSFCYKYIGPQTKGYEELLLPIKEMRNKDQLELNL